MYYSLVILQWFHLLWYWNVNIITRAWWMYHKLPTIFQQNLLFTKINILKSHKKIVLYSKIFNYCTLSFDISSLYNYYVLKADNRIFYQWQWLQIMQVCFWKCGCCTSSWFDGLFPFYCDVLMLHGV